MRHGGQLSECCAAATPCHVVLSDMNWCSVPLLYLYACTIFCTCRHGGCRSQPRPWRGAWQCGRGTQAADAQVDGLPQGHLGCPLHSCTGGAVSTCLSVYVGCVCVCTYVRMNVCVEGVYTAYSVPYIVALTQLAKEFIRFSIFQPPSFLNCS